jgi:hypothetical protein
MGHDEPSFHNGICNTPSLFLQEGSVGVVEHKLGLGRGLLAKGEIAPKVTSVWEASGWWRTTMEIINTLEVQVFGDMAWWTRVASLFVGHRNICKSQRTVMTHDCIVIS